MENISPAMLHVPTTPAVSSQEFQRMLQAWFEDNGIVSDLRSYLRVLMINRLRNTNLGKIDGSKQPFSLAKQAFCLVIAEHLMREGWHYTLSIFSTEVPGIGAQLPFSLFEPSNQDNWRFDNECVFNLLELIGIGRNSEESVRISTLYYQNYGSLLTCLIHSKVVPKQNFTLEGDMDVQRILSATGIPSNIINHLLGKIQHEKNDNFNAQIAEKEAEMKRLINENRDHIKDKKLMKGELKEARKRINQLILKESCEKIREQNLKEENQHCALKHCQDSCEKLHEQLAHSQKINLEKSAEIDRLNTKLRSLVRDLQNSQIKIDFLNSCLAKCYQLNLQQDTNILTDLSEENSDNSTDDVIKEARLKLQQLERESDELELKLQKLKMK